MMAFMEVITTHLNADFDAFASMVAAKKLYPNAVVAFPGSQEKSLRDFFIESTLYILAIERAKDIDLDAVRRLILVDTRQKSRIGRFADIAESDDVEVHIYDHHPESDDDVAGEFEIIKQIGSTTTILTGLIREQGLEVDAEQATIMALGIHEDTGSFTFSSTTSEDMEAAAWLLSKGANLNIIANMMTSEMDRDQIQLLHQLIEESEVVRIGGIDIIVCTASVEGYVGDLAVVVQKYRDMENPQAIFALVRMENRVHLVARSNIHEVDVGDITTEFGGGGHAFAAGATIHNLALYQAKDRLVTLLYSKVEAKREARQIMSKPVYTIAPDQSLNQASADLSRYQISSLPVVRNGEVIGILHRNSLEKAIRLGLDGSAVSRYTDPEIASVPPDASIDDVLEVALQGRHRLILVMDEGRLTGVISRTDLLEHMKLPAERDSVGPDEFSASRAAGKNIKKVMAELLPERVMLILQRAGETASVRSEEVYLVGGAVRDLLLRNNNLDIDLVVEGEGIPFARELAEQFEGCEVRSHEKFGTATIQFEDGFRVDVATSRHEYYARPGALPTVEMSSIKKDLYRRDFTINTLAVSLNPAGFGRVIDFFGGVRDIKDKVIRVLHNLAFIEDPTRLLRAVRFCCRFGFSIGKHTLSLIKAAVKANVFDKVEGKRLLNELIHMLDEKNPIPGLIMMEELRILHALHPALEFGVRTRDLLQSIAGVLAWWRFLFLDIELHPWQVYFLGLTSQMEDGDFRAIALRFSIPESKVERLASQRRYARHSLNVLAKRIETPSSSYRILRQVDWEHLLLMMAMTSKENTRRMIADYITTYRHVRPVISGQDLIEMGYTPGPLFHEILEKVRDARLDGLVSGADQERQLVAEHFPLSGK